MAAPNWTAMAFVLCPSGALLAKARGFVAGLGVLPGSIEPSDIEVTVTAKKISTLDLHSADASQAERVKHLECELCEGRG